MAFNQIITTNNDGKAFKAYVAHPEGAGPFPGLIVMHEVYGVTPSIEKIADWYAAQGFLAVAPNMYWESDENASFEYERPQDAGREDFLKQQREAARDLMFHFVNRGRADLGLTAAAAQNDVDGKTAQLMGYIETVAAWLRQQPDCTGKVAATGFCFGARNTYLALAKKTSVNAGVSFYPTPVLAEVFRAEEAAAIDKPFLAFFGAQDPYITAGEKNALRQAAGTALAYVTGLDRPFVHRNSAGNPKIGAIVMTASTHGWNRSNSPYTDAGTSAFTLRLASKFLHAALGDGAFTIPPEAYTTAPDSPTYCLKPKV